MLCSEVLPFKGRIQVGMVCDSTWGQPAELASIDKRNTNPAQPSA
jgi:hypothetical protein